MKKFSIFFMVFISFFVASCSSTPEGKNSRTSISDIKKNPSSYEGKVVTIEGEVVSSLSVMGGLFQIYEAYSDDTLWVKVGDGQELPKVRTFVRVQGSVDTTFKILNQNYGTVFLSRSIKDLDKE